MTVPSFVEYLGGLTDDHLVTLLRLRPDLAVPAPTDVTALANRAQSRVSVARALDGLDRFHLELVDAVRLARDPAFPSPAVPAAKDGPRAADPPGGHGPRAADPAGSPGATSMAAVVALARAGHGEVDAARVLAGLRRLRELAVLYGTDDTLCLVETAEEVCSPYPAGLGRPAAELDAVVAALCTDAARLRRTVLSAPPGARAVLDRLAAGPPVGTVAPPAPAGPSSPASQPEATENPVSWLVARGLLVPVPAPAGSTGAAYQAVELPREVGLLLRRESGPLGALHPAPPAVPAARPDPPDLKAADQAGAGQAMEAVRLVESLLEALSAEPAAVLRSGGLGVRDLRRLARTIGQDEAGTALLLEVAYAAGLFGEAEPPTTGRRTSTGHGGQEFLPTFGYDTWCALSIARRWEQLARAWLGMTRQAGLVGQRDERDRPVGALSPEVERLTAPATRRAALAALDELEPGTAPEVDGLLELLAWRAPRRAKGREQHTREVLAEAARLGVTGRGALTSYGRLLLDDDRWPEDDPLGLHTDAEPAERSSPIAVLDALLPPPVDHLLVQADLSVVVPGPPEADLATELSLVAEHESAGGATVYRITAQSVRRALDAGYLAADLHAMFARRSRTPIPQALTYLVDDVARRHGGLRTGPAGAYLRSEDPALLAEVLADRRLTGLRLRRLAPTVLVGPHSPTRLVAALREAGYAPVPEDATGAAVLTRPKARRATGRGPLAGRVDDVFGGAAAGGPRFTEPRLHGIVEQLRRGEAAARSARRTPVTVRAATGQGVSTLTAVQAHTQALAVLQQAIRDRALVWVGYVDAHGATASRLVRPVSIGAGYLRAEDERSQTLHTFALHRITAAALDQ